MQKEETEADLILNLGAWGQKMIARPTPKIIKITKQAYDNND